METGEILNIIMGVVLNVAAISTIYYLFIRKDKNKK